GRVRADSPPIDGYPTINSADAEGGSLFIGGVHFGAALSPVVKLGGTTLTVTSYSPTAIVATLPSGMGPASYPLWVKSFATPSSFGLWSYIAVTVGAVGPQGLQGEAGKAGQDGPGGR